MYLAVKVGWASAISVVILEVVGAGKWPQKRPDFV